MSLELAKVLLNRRSLSSALKDAPLSDLELMVEKLTGVVEERRADELKLIEDRRRQEVALKSVVDKIHELDVSIDDVIHMLSSSKATVTKGAKRQKRPAKYKYVDENQNDKYWTGQGRTPKIIQQQLDNGAKLEDFAI